MNPIGPIPQAATWPPERPPPSSPSRGPSDLAKRVWFTLGALVVFRLGTYIPLPGVDWTIWAQIAEQQRGAVTGAYNLFTGGAFSRMSLFALGIMPYMIAGIMMALLAVVSPPFEALRNQGEAGRRRFGQYIRIIAVLLAASQGYAIAVSLEAMIVDGAPAVIDPGMLFQLSVVTTVAAGTAFLMWLGELITVRGVGNGFALILFTGVVAGLPGAFGVTFEMSREGTLPAYVIVVLLLGVIAIGGLIVFIERAQRRVVVQYPRRRVGDRVYGGESSFLPLKINTAGLIPLFFANCVLLPLMVGSWAGWSESVAALLDRGQPGYLLIYLALIVLFALYYVRVGFDPTVGVANLGKFGKYTFRLIYGRTAFSPTETADNLERYGGYVPGIRPGANTAAHLHYVQTRLTATGVVYLAALGVLPEILISRYDLPFFFSGVSLLILFVVTMDTLAVFQYHLLGQRNDELIKK